MTVGPPRLVFALDTPDLKEAERLVSLLRDCVPVFKVGLELFSAIGPRAVEMVRNAGAECFLDLKLHDIPNTVRQAVTAAGRSGATFLTLHALNGPHALHAAQEAAAEHRLQLLAITVLSSHNSHELSTLGLPSDPRVLALRLARLAQECGIHGLVTSAHECADLRSELGDECVIAVPGIRAQDSAKDDQQRTATAAEAVAAGANLLVVGRPIRLAPDPKAAAEAILAEIEGTKGSART